MSKNSAPHLQPTLAKRPWLWLVLVGFLWLQLVGMLHKHSHTDLPQASTNFEVSQLEKLLPEHSQQSKSDCQLLDLHCSGLSLSQALPALTFPVFALPIAWHQAATFFNSPRFVCQARAPPKPSI